MTMNIIYKEETHITELLSAKVEGILFACKIIKGEAGGDIEL